MRLILSLFLLVATPLAALAEPIGVPAFSVSTAGDGSQSYTLSLQLLALMTGITLLPAFLVMMTSFTRIIVVLAILRQALGTAQTPSNQVLLGLTLFLTLFIMNPVLERINTEAVQPYVNEELGFQDAVAKAQVPLHAFMLHHTRETDLTLFMEIAGKQAPDDAKDVGFVYLMPAFVTSELKTAFQFGFLIFIPFLIIDLVVASVLMSMGMMMLSPLIISFPFKILLFVLVDGWTLILGTLASSFYV